MVERALSLDPAHETAFFQDNRNTDLRTPDWGGFGSSRNGVSPGRAGGHRPLSARTKLLHMTSRRTIQAHGCLVLHRACTI
jgi:hypothetical protein